MKRFSGFLLSFILLFTMFASSAMAATTGSVTSYKKDNAAKETSITGSGKYMKFKVTYTGSKGDYPGMGGYGELYKMVGSSRELIVSFNVSADSKSQSTDVWLDKNATYIIKADADIYSASDAYVTASIQER